MIEIKTERTLPAAKQLDWLESSLLFVDFHSMRRLSTSRTTSPLQCHLSGIFFIASLRLALALLLFLLLLAGCSNKAKPAKATSAQSATQLAAGNSAGESAEIERPSENSFASSDRLSHSAASLETMAGSAESAAVPIGESGQWTERRLVAFAETGPVVIDFFISSGRDSLEDATQTMAVALAETLMKEVRSVIAKRLSHVVEMMSAKLPGDSPAMPAALDTDSQSDQHRAAEDSSGDWLAGKEGWNDLIDLPLVSSGWLGNLVADADQRTQIVDMYDADGDKNVDRDELSAFLSRGLSRTSPLQFSDIGNVPDNDRGRSPWGPADTNRDFSLDASELDELPKTLSQFDANSDGILAAAEVIETQPANQNSMGQSRMLNVESLAIFELPATEANKAAEADIAKTKRKLTKQILQHYTFLESVNRDRWSGCSETTWLALDVNRDGTVTRLELEGIFDCPPDLRCYVRLAKSGSAELPTSVHIEQFGAPKMQNLPDEEFSWIASKQIGQWSGQHFVLNVQIQDSFNSATQSQFRQILSASLNNAQLRSGLTQQLQLAPHAFDLLDNDSDGLLSDAEWQSAWQWISLRQADRCVARWMISSQPWFLLADRNGDQRLSEQEMRGVVHSLRQLDRNSDERITPNELPLVVKLEISREDSRLRGFARADSLAAVSSTDDWFTAMDTNGDAVVSLSEFLGDLEDFRAIDRDKDDFLSADEVYAPQLNE